MDHMLLRFLRARKFKVTDAWDMLTKDYAWREEVKVDEIRQKTPESVLNLPDLSVLQKNLPSWFQGCDKQGRPVLFKRFGRCDVGAMLQHTTLQNLLNHHIWTQENLMHQLGPQTVATGYNVETVCAVFDAAGWRLGLATSAAYSFLKGMAELDSLHYPERLGAIYVVNSPKMLSVAWRIIRSWLDERTKTKINILGDINEFGPILREIMDEDTVLPVEFGGKAASLEQIHEPSSPTHVQSPTYSSAEMEKKDQEALEIANKMANDLQVSPQESPRESPQESKPAKKSGWW